MEKVILGNIVKPQGIRGEVKVRPQTVDLEAVGRIKEVFFESGETVKVENCAVRGGFAFIKLFGVNTRNDAESLRNKTLYMEKKEVKLKKGEYFVKDIIGCRLSAFEGLELGVITAIDNFGAADVYTAETSDGKVFRFPYIKALKAEIDTAGKTMKVDGKVFSEVCIYEGAE